MYRWATRLKLIKNERMYMCNMHQCVIQVFRLSSYIIIPIYEISWCWFKKTKKQTTATTKQQQIAWSTLFIFLITGSL